MALGLTLATDALTRTSAARHHAHSKSLDVGDITRLDGTILYGEYDAESDAEAMAGFLREMVSSLVTQAADNGKMLTDLDELQGHIHDMVAQMQTLWTSIDFGDKKSGKTAEEHASVMALNHEAALLGVMDLMASVKFTEFIGVPDEPAS